MSSQDGSGDAGQGKKPVIRVQRRRPSTSAGSEGRERAEAPRREPRQDQGSTARSSSGIDQAQTPSSSQWSRAVRSGGSRTPLSGRSMLLLLILAMLLLCGCLIMYWIFGRGGGTDQGTVPPTEEAQAAEVPVVAPTELSDTPAPVATAKPFVAPTRAATGKTWLVMLYEDADDKILEQDVCVDLNEAERVGSSDTVRIVAQLDRFKGGYTGDGDWTSTRRFYVTQDNDLQHIGSQLVADLGEKNMADPETLIDFVTWAMQTFPADKYALILSDHGMGWPGGGAIRRRRPKAIAARLSLRRPAISST